MEVNSIKSVHILYKEDKWKCTRIYTLDDGTIVEWDKNNASIKKTLLKQQKNIDKFKEEDAQSLSKYILNKKTTNYSPIKVISLKEFGCIKTNKNTVVFYGIMGENTFIDLTNDIVYF